MEQKGDKVNILNLNPPTELSIGTMLRLITDMESTPISNAQIEHIRNHCNKDLRNAIQTL